MVIYADVLVAVNYFVSYLMLRGCSRLSGIPLSRRRNVVGALVGGLAALTAFLPLQGFWAGLACRGVSGLAMVLTAWPGRSRKEVLRLLLLLLTVSFLFAGLVVAWCFLFPKSPVFLIGPNLYFHLSPVTLLVTVTAAYLALELLQRLRSRGRCRSMVSQAELARGGSRVSLRLLRDSGNTLVEPFSGLPVAVCCFSAVSGLLTEGERSWFGQGAAAEGLPCGMRLVAYRSVGAEGLLGAFRPDSLVLWEEGKACDCAAWVAVCPADMPGCDGVFNPAMLELRI